MMALRITARRLPALAAGLAMLNGAAGAVPAVPAPDLSPAPGPQTEPASQPAVHPETSPSVDKSGFTLLNPTPRDQMRPFVTDRPTLTTGPFTVDAGHFQLEMDFASYAYDRRSPGSAERNVQTLVLADPTFRIGLLNDLELQVSTPPLVGRLAEEEGGTSSTRWGAGDTVVRLKRNLWGNDAADPGSTALALLGYLKFPSNTDHLGNHFIEGGFVVPLNVVLPAGFQVGAMTEFDVFHNGGAPGYHLEWLNTVELSKELVKDRLSGYVEFAASVSREPHTGPLETADCGLVYLLAPDVQLDGGVNVGLTRRAYDFNPFLGLSIRF